MKNEKSNMYEFVKTWNPLAGECSHKCIYCSTQKFDYPNVKIKYSGQNRLCGKSIFAQPRLQDTTIFVCAQNDLFAKNVSSEIITKILSECQNKKVTYFFQSKNPLRFFDFEKQIPLNSILCTTLESDIVPTSTYKSPVPSIFERIVAMKNIHDFEKHITIEPIMKMNNIEKFAYQIYLTNPTQVHIGANSFKKIKLLEPSAHDIHLLINLLQEFTIVNLKTNLPRLLSCLF
jgi:DNA repair photolyase